MTKLVQIVIVSLLAISAAAQDRAVVTPRAAAAMAGSSGSQANYWLFLDPSVFQAQPVKLTDRALARRAKVDPVGLLLDSLDQPIAPPVLESIRQSGARVRHVSRWFRAVSLEATPDQMASLTSLPAVRRVDLVSTLYSQLPPEQAAEAPRAAAPDASAVDLEYGPSVLQNRFVNAIKMHQAGYTGKGVLIAMFDTGFNTNHEAFDSTSILHTWDFINNDADVTGAECVDFPQHNHGTATFGALGGYVPGNLIGVAFDADFALAKTEITCGGTEIKVEEDNWIAAAEWADSIGADIISASLGYNRFQDVPDANDYTLADLDGNTALITIAADIAASKNILVCVSAGNERNDPVWPRIVFPADGDSVMAVGAVSSDSSIAGFSSPGPSANGRIKPDIATLGVGVYSAAAFSTTSYGGISGTSLSAPLAAGGAALAMDYDSTVTAAELLAMIRQTADRADNPNNDYGYGLIDAADAANILRVVIDDSIDVSADDGGEFLVETAGTSGETPALTGFQLPAGYTLVDSGNGRGSLVLQPGSATASVRVGVVAAITNFADTAYVTLIPGGSDPMRAVIRAFPNPFTGSLTITGGSAGQGLQTVSVFNSAGEKVWERVNISPGSSDTVTIEWDGRNTSGKNVTPGVYVIRVQTDRRTETVKVLKVQ